METRRVAASLTVFYDAMLAPSGVTARQYFLLLNIFQAENCSVKELADMSALDRSTLARSLKPLYQRGFIVDTKEPGTRNSRLEVTKAGRKKVEYAKQLWEETQKTIERTLGPAGMQEFERVMALLETI
jgi:DNA-binding MarR family transcriptional regulator